MPKGRKPPCDQRFAKLAVAPKSADVEEDHDQSGDDERDDGDHLDQREPELQFTEHAHREQVGAVEHHEGDERRQPLRHVREPVAHVDADRGELGHRDHDPHQPVGPAGHEAGEGSAEFLRVGGEGAGDRAVRQQFPESAHDEEDRDAAQHVGEQQARAGIVDGLGRAEEQADADRAADGDELDVPVAQVARQADLGVGHGGFFRLGWLVKTDVSCAVARAGHSGAPAAARSVARSRAAPEAPRLAATPSGCAAPAGAALRGDGQQHQNAGAAAVRVEPLFHRGAAVGAAH